MPDEPKIVTLPIDACICRNPERPARNCWATVHGPKPEPMTVAEFLYEVGPSLGFDCRCDETSPHPCEGCREREAYESRS